MQLCTEKPAGCYYADHDVKQSKTKHESGSPAIGSRLVRNAAHNEMTKERSELPKYINTDQHSSSHSQELFCGEVVGYDALMDVALTHKPHQSFISYPCMIMLFPPSLDDSFHLFFLFCFTQSFFTKLLWRRIV